VAGELDIHWASGRGDLDGAIAVREQVFCVEQGVPVEEEIDGRDEQAMHLVAVEDGRVVATLRLLLEGQNAKIGRVAVRREQRRRGIARRMLDLAVEAARAHGCERASLASQLYATGLYEQAGFAVDSAPFEDAGLPHVWMRRAL
jgi:predicted GNAT family N-acyltransferase